MKQINLKQGTPEWATHRAQHFNASDAPAMMACSPYRTRQHLVRERATGIVDAEIDAATARRFADGHRAEALARPLAEEIVGEELYPVVGVADAGPYSASFDGLTLLEDRAFEHKALNDTLRAAFDDMETIAPEHRECTAGSLLPLPYRVQMEHQAMVCPSIERILFMASKWADDGTLIDERHCWYYPDPKLRAAIVAGWEQFAADVAAYTPEPAIAPAPVGRAPDALPAVRLEVTGAVTASNLADFKAHALAVIGAINRDLQTDADFADAEKTVKWCAEAEARLKAAKDNAIAQTATIEEAFRIVDDVSAELRRTRLELEKLVKAEKESRRTSIVTDAIAALRGHIEGLNKRLGRPYMPAIDADFNGSIKSKKSLDSMRDAVAAELARAKIEANEVADRIQINLDTMNRLAGAYTGMFPDAQVLVLKSPEDCELQVQARVDRRKAEEQARIDAERQRIAAEERAKAEAAAEADRARIRAEEEARARRTQEAVEAERRLTQTAAAPAIAPAPALAPAPVLETVAAAAPAANEPPPAGAVPTLRIGAIAERLGWTMTAEQLRALGIEPAGKERGAVLFHEQQFPAICEAIARRAMEARAAHLQRLAA